MSDLLKRGSEVSLAPSNTGKSIVKFGAGGLGIWALAALMPGGIVLWAILFIVAGLVL